MDWLDSLDPHWFWIATGLFLAAAEMVVPGVFLIWLGIAALLTGLLTWLLPIGIFLQVLVFAVLSVVSIWIGRNYLLANPIAEADPAMNKRTSRLVGEVATVTEAVSDGQGRIHHGDSEWIARGPDVPAGAKVRIVGAQGAVLVVEPL
ncbi:MAG: NfeD family protein [Sphingomonadales bacterium]|nr:NfeD family protein [Sphingomonadales bacterium]MBD3775066.1 NfeD family protein [Paracoccaceae bacterium]